MTRWISCAVVALSMIGACAHNNIRGTQIADTPENHEIFEIVRAYTDAVEHRDADAVLALVSPRYYEDNGNTDRSDDYDYQGLKVGLTEDFGRTKAMQMQVRLDDIKVDGDNAYAEIYYTYRAQNEYPSGLRWDTGSDRTRLRFERDPDGSWLIIGGL